MLTTHQFMPEFSAGTEVLTFETAKELNRRGHKVEVWTAYPASVEKAKGKSFDFYEYEGLPVHVYNHSHHVLNGNNAMEAEYNNLFFAERFRDYIKKTKPDIVHFFHLMRLGASAIDVSTENRVPCILTPTDFWMICPTCQLRLPDNELCIGPDPDSLNCVRHVVSISLGGPVWQFVPKIPLWFFKRLIKGARKTWWPDRRYSPLISALANRKDFLMQRLNKLDRVLVPTRFMETMLVNNGFNSGASTFIPYGLNLTPFKSGCEKKLGSGRLRVGFIGTLREHKGAHILLEAVRMLPKELPLSLSVYGNPKEDLIYGQLLEKLCKDDLRVKFCGNFPNSQIAEVFSEIDVLVVPSIWYENTPLVIYSAFASGTPVIATNLGGMSEVVHHEVNGLLFEKGDAKGLSLLLKRIVEDKTLLERLSKNVAPPPSISDYVDGLEGVYKDVLAKRRKK